MFFQPPNNFFHENYQNYKFYRWIRRVDEINENNSLEVERGKKKFVNPSKKFFLKVAFLFNKIFR